MPWRAKDARLASRAPAHESARPHATRPQRRSLGLGAGVRYFDTALLYGFGLAERRGRPPRNLPRAAAKDSRRSQQPLLGGDLSRLQRRDGCRACRLSSALVTAVTEKCLTARPVPAKTRRWI